MTTTPTQETHQLLARLDDHRMALRRAEFERLELARDWALAHVVTGPDLLGDPRRRPTPLGSVALAVDEFAHAELGAALEMHPLAGRRLMADAVDLHDRLPIAWAAVGSGCLEAWVAREIAAATSDLSDERTRWVDAVIGDLYATLPAGRLLRLVVARVVEADQALADRKAAEAAAARTVWMSRHVDHGTRTLVVRGSGDGVRRLQSTVDYLARLLLDEHGTADQRARSIDERRADAAELLANPLAALKLLVGAGDVDLPDAIAEAIRTAGPAKVRPSAIVYVHLTPALSWGEAWRGPRSSAR